MIEYPPNRGSVLIQMRSLWHDHVLRTRLFLMDPVPARYHALLANQIEIGEAWGSFYGTESGKRLTRMLVEHIDHVRVYAFGRDKARDRALRMLFVNAEQMAWALTRDNPRLSRRTVLSLIREHLAFTRQEIDEILSSKSALLIWAHIQRNARNIAEALANGIADHLRMP